MKNAVTQLHNLTPESLATLLGREIDQRFNQLKENFKAKQSTELLTRHEVAALFKVDISTVHNWTKSGKIQAYAVGSRVYYKREQLESSLIKLNK